MSNDININESAILETLNAKIDYDGGNYKGSGLANYVVDKSGDTMTGQIKFDDVGVPLLINNNSMDTTITPTSNKYSFFDFYDVNKTRVGVIGVQHKASTGLYGAYLQAGNQASLVVSTDGTNAYFEFPRCTTKATTTSSAANNKVAVIVQNYVNGTSWYRVWSDGWKEQGGVFVDTTSVTYLKSFSNTNYTIVLNYIEGTSGDVVVGQIAPRRTTTGFTINSSSISKSWYACGY